MFLRNISRHRRRLLGKKTFLAFAAVALFALGTVGCSDNAPPGQNQKADVKDGSPQEQGVRLDGVDAPPRQNQEVGVKDSSQQEQGIRLDGDDAPPGQNQELGVKDSSQQEQGVRLDNGQTKKDAFVWPDSGKHDSASDLWPNPGDAYRGTPFGCVTDADCFGLTCCKTPWGVKLCAKRCN